MRPVDEAKSSGLVESTRLEEAKILALFDDAKKLLPDDIKKSFSITMLELKAALGESISPKELADAIKSGRVGHVISDRELKKVHEYEKARLKSIRIKRVRYKR